MYLLLHLFPPIVFFIFAKNCSLETVDSWQSLCAEFTRVHKHLAEKYEHMLNKIENGSHIKRDFWVKKRQRNLFKLQTQALKQEKIV